MSRVHHFAIVLAAMLLAACGGRVPDAGPAKTPPKTDTAKVENGHVRYQAPNGQVTMEGNLLNGKREGEWTGYSESGRVKSRNTYRAGVLEGLSTVFHDNGKVYYTGWQAAGKQVGLWRFYDEQGNLLKTVDYGEAPVINNAGQAH